MERRIDYDRFFELHELVMKLPLSVNEKQREGVFRTLTNFLVSKGVFNGNGRIEPYRDSAVEYFYDIAHKFNDEELNLFVSNLEELYERFIFAPHKKNTSLLNELRRIGAGKFIESIHFDEIVEQYRNETGRSPYEKVSHEELYPFIASLDEIGISDLDKFHDAFIP